MYQGVTSPDVPAVFALHIGRSCESVDISWSQNIVIRYTYVCTRGWRNRVCVYVCVCAGLLIDIKKVDKQLTHAIHVKDRHVNDTFIDKLTKWYQ